MPGATHLGSYPRASGIFRHFAKTPAVEEKGLRKASLNPPCLVLPMLGGIWGLQLLFPQESDAQNRSSTAKAATT